MILEDKKGFAKLRTKAGVLEGVKEDIKETTSRNIT